MVMALSQEGVFIRSFWMEESLGGGSQGRNSHGEDLVGQLGLLQSRGSLCGVVGRENGMEVSGRV